MAVVIRRRVHGNTFGLPEKIFSGKTPDEIIEELQQLNAQLTYSIMMKDFDIKNLQQSNESLANMQANMTYQLMLKGVL